MSVTLDDREVAAFLDDARAGILTTLRRDGWPVPLPVWFVRRRGAIYVRTLRGSKKVGRARRDDRVSFLVERGERWSELTAVLLTGRAAIVDDDEEVRAVGAAIDEKYAALRPQPSTLPSATKRHYRAASVVLRIDALEPPISWDNGKIRRRAAGEEERT